MHCPKCKNDAATEWLQRLTRLLLPVTYFLVTVTLPDTLRRVARSNQKLIYNLLFRYAAFALQKLATDPRYVGGRLGIIGVLHTWTRDLRYHPHVHFIVAGGGLSADGEKWLPLQRDYLMPVKPLGIIFRAKFRDALKSEEPALFEQLPKQTWRKDWVVDIIPVGSGKRVLKYLALYIFRVAISNKRIVRFANGQVTFKYKPSDSKKWQMQTLPAEKFISRFLQHVYRRGSSKCGTTASTVWPTAIYSMISKNCFVSQKSKKKTSMTATRVSVRL